VKILYLAPDALAAPKGAAVRIGLTLDALRAQGHEVETFTPERPEPGTPAANFLERMLSFREAAARWLEGRGADLVQFRGLWDGLPAAAWARRHGARAVWEAHGFPSIELPYHFPGLVRRGAVLDKLVREERALLSLVHHVLVPSETTARYLRRLGVPDDRVSVVPNGVDTEAFRPAAVAPPDTMPLRLVYVGTLSPWQGLATALEALALLRGRALPELHVIGPTKAPWRAALRGLARGLRVHHALHLSGPMAQADLPAVLATAHVCLAPLPDDPRNSVQGCCPLKILEYMAAARPILSTRVGAVEEILEHGASAHLVRPGSAAALAEGLAWMMDHPAEREALGARARELAVARWTIGHFRERLQAALARACPASGAVAGPAGLV
jgi:glycosyltransferase involved in cell wall biosynthesis